MDYGPAASEHKFNDHGLWFTQPYLDATRLLNGRGYRGFGRHLVFVQAHLTALQLGFPKVFCGKDFLISSSRATDFQDAHLVIRRIAAFKADVAAVSVANVAKPSAEKAISPGRAAHILLFRARTGQEVDPPLPNPRPTTSR